MPALGYSIVLGGGDPTEESNEVMDTWEIIAVAILVGFGARVGWGAGDAAEAAFLSLFQYFRRVRAR